MSAASGLFLPQFTQKSCAAQNWFIVLLFNSSVNGTNYIESFQIRFGQPNDTPVTWCQIPMCCLYLFFLSYLILKVTNNRYLTPAFTTASALLSNGTTCVCGCNSGTKPRKGAVWQWSQNGGEYFFFPCGLLVLSSGAQGQSRLMVTIQKYKIKLGCANQHKFS